MLRGLIKKGLLITASFLFFGFFTSSKSDLSIFLTKSRIKKGGNAYLIFHFKIKDGWHIYWKDPGQRGLPTTVQMQEIEGIKYGKLLFPVPDILRLSDGSYSYVHKGDVYLFLPIIVSEKFNGNSADIVGVLRWAECSDTLCVPHKKEFSVKVSIGKSEAKEAGSSRRIDSSVYKRFPIDYRAKGSPAVVKYRLEREKGVLVLDVEWATNPFELECFIADGDGVQIEQVKKESISSGARVVFSVKKSKKGEAEAEIVLKNRLGTRAVLVPLHL
ncbi:MAG: hypothetical protein D6780_07690 [Candidatus Dadabacteria bacterium]|nr:MAG: hypothetical protein D6780_07690 [Candidatus Dadabacteria bacterium]